MCSNLLPTALVVVGLVFPIAAHAQEGKTKLSPGAKFGKVEAYYSADEKLRDKVKLSDAMTAKLFEIIGRESKPFERTITAAPRGYFVVGEKAYAFYGFIASDPSKGNSWDDPALNRFWEELNRVGDKLGLLKDFKP